MPSPRTLVAALTGAGRAPGRGPARDAVGSYAIVIDGQAKTIVDSLWLGRVRDAGSLQDAADLTGQPTVGE